MGLLEGMNEHLGEGLNLVDAAHFASEKRQFDNVKVLVELMDLVQVLVLHLVSHQTLLAIRFLFRKQQLIHNYSS